VVVEGSVDGVLDPFVEFFLGGVGDVEVGEEFGAEGQVGDFVVGTDVVDLVHLTLVEDGVESIRGVASEEVASSRGTITMKDNGLASVEEEGEFGNDFW
jgi:hypothetical protein